MHLNPGGVEALLLIAAVVSMLARRFHLPYTVALTLAGLALSWLPVHFGVPLSRQLLFSALLPPLIFEAALQIHWSQFRRNLLVTATLATAGVLISALVTVLGMHALTAWPITTCLLFAVLISATDPVSVVATFRDCRVTGRLAFLVETESLLNDGTAAALFAIVLVAMQSGRTSVWSFGSSFVLIVAGSTVCGAVVGGAILLVAGRSKDHLVELTLTSVAAFGSFLLADRLGLSGVLATLTAGILIGNFGPLGVFTHRGKEAVEAFWEFMAFIANSLVFLLIGLGLSHHLELVAWPAAVAIVLVLVGRAAAVYSCCLPFSWSTNRVTLNHQHVLVWGGLRGALALALALGLPSEVPMRQEVLEVAFAVVAFSVVVQGLTMRPFLARLGELPGPGPAPR